MYWTTASVDADYYNIFKVVINIVDISHFEVLQLIVYAYTCSAYVIIIYLPVLGLVFGLCCNVFHITSSLLIIPSFSPSTPSLKLNFYFVTRGAI